MRATVVSWTRQAAPRGTGPLAARPQPPPSAARNVTVPPTEVESKFGVTTRVRPHGWKRLRQPANDVTAQLASRSVTTVRGLMSAPSQRGCTKLTRRRQVTVNPGSWTMARCPSLVRLTTHRARSPSHDPHRVRAVARVIPSGPTAKPNSNVPCPGALGGNRLRRVKNAVDAPSSLSRLVCDSRTTAW